jgi:hypothetical protein
MKEYIFLYNDRCKEKSDFSGSKARRIKRYRRKVTARKKRACWCWFFKTTPILPHAYNFNARLHVSAQKHTPADLLLRGNCSSNTHTAVGGYPSQKVSGAKKCKSTTTDKGSSNMLDKYLCIKIVDIFFLSLMFFFFLSPL